MRLQNVQLHCVLCVCVSVSVGVSLSVSAMFVFVFRRGAQPKSQADSGLLATIDVLVWWGWDKIN